MILRKLEYLEEGGSQKHIDDIRGVVALSGDSLERQVLQKWIDQRETHRAWQQCFADGFGGVK